jgi:cobalt-zinc-cadmium efflux system outer membrane protein
MMKQLFIFSLLALSTSVQALEPISPPGLLPTEIARPLLEQSPSVIAARAGLNVALEEAGILDKSPYEWVARATGQQRRVENGNNYNEWNVGIEHAIRLPGKATADRNLGKLAIEESQAVYGEALHEAARELMATWLDWLAAENAHKLAEDNLQSVRENLTSVEKRVRAGDASKLDVNVAQAELAEQKRLANDAKTQASATWSRLSTRFPGVKRDVIVLPTPALIGEDTAPWKERIMAESDELKIVQTKMLIAQARVDRARANEVPDPTLGLHTASEVGGRERISGITFSIPIPGGLRNSHSAKAISEVEVSRQEVEITRRELESGIASAIVTSQGSYDSVQIAEEGTTTMQQNASLMQRAYSLGEAELQALLLSRRQATTAMNNSLQAKAAALKAYYGLLVDAHLIWDLAHD